MKTRAGAIQALLGLVLIGISVALIYWPASFGAVGFLLFMEAAWGKTG